MDDGKQVRAGDVVGVGWIPAKRVLFFTQEGVVVPKLATALDGDFPVKGLVEAVADTMITVNFGKAEFSFKVRALCFPGVLRGDRHVGQWLPHV